MRVAWMLGWGVPAAWFAPLAQQAFPTADHVLIPAGPDAIGQLEREPRLDLIVGYSLGAQLLLGVADRLRPPVGLLAPIFAFPQERGLGGRVAGTQVRYLSRWLKRDPAAALQDFYQRAGLDILPESVPVGALDELSWGLDRLLNAELPAKLPAGWTALCGASDALLDAERLHAIDPRIHVVPGATHHPGTLLPVLAQVLSRAVVGAHIA